MANSKKTKLNSFDLLNQSRQKYTRNTKSDYNFKAKTQTNLLFNYFYSNEGKLQPDKTGMNKKEVSVDLEDIKKDFEEMQRRRIERDKEINEISIGSVNEGHEKAENQIVETVETVSTPRSDEKNEKKKKITKLDYKDFWNCCCKKFCVIM